MALAILFSPASMTKQQYDDIIRRLDAGGRRARGAVVSRLLRDLHGIARAGHLGLASNV